MKSTYFFGKLWHRFQFVRNAGGIWLTDKKRIALTRKLFINKGEKTINQLFWNIQKWQKSNHGNSTTVQ